MTQRTNARNHPEVLGRRSAILSMASVPVLTAKLAEAQPAAKPPETPAPTDDQRDAFAELATQDLLYDPASPVLGNPTGDVTITEFFDYRCPYCKVMAPRLVTLIAKDHGVRLVMKEYPVLSRASVIAARVALAVARHGKYQAFHSAMFAVDGPFDEARILGVVRSIGLDPALIANEMKSREIEAELRRNLALGHILGVRGTPAFVMGGVIVPGAVPLEALEKLIAAERKQQQQQQQQE